MRKIIVYFMFIFLMAGSLFSQYKPGVMFSTILNGVKIAKADKNEVSFGFERFLTTFLEPDTEGRLVVKSADGSELASAKFVAEANKNPVTSVNLWTLHPVKLDEGNYTVEFETDGETFYTYPFAITKIPSDNPFEGGDKYFLEGDWADWGYFYYSNARPDQMLQWKVWLRNKSMANTKDVKVDINIASDKDNKVICIGREGVTYTLRNDWTRFQFDMVWPKEKEAYGSYFKAQDLLNTDGDYTLTISIDGKEYGKWKFTVKDNKFQLKGRADRKTAAPPSFIEGGVDAFWFEREK